MRLIKSTLTPTNGVATSSPLCVKLVDRKSNDFIATGMHSSVDQSYVTSFGGDNDSESIITTATLSTITATRPSPVSILSTKHRAIAKNKRLHSQAHESIARRLPARSRATMHRLYHTPIGQHLRPRAVSPATRQRVHALEHDLRQTGDYNLGFPLTNTPTRVPIVTQSPVRRRH